MSLKGSHRWIDIPKFYAQLNARKNKIPISLLKLKELSFEHLESYTKPSKNLMEVKKFGHVEMLKKPPLYPKSRIT